MGAICKEANDVWIWLGVFGRRLYLLVKLVVDGKGPSRVQMASYTLNENEMRYIYSEIDEFGSIHIGIVYGSPRNYYHLSMRDATSPF
jgi:hypothetical protein